MEHDERTERKVFIARDEFAGLISVEALMQVISHQESAYRNGEFIDQPFPEPDKPELEEAFRQFAGNRETYDEEPDIEAAIDTDEIFRGLLPEDPTKNTPERARAIRSRISVVAGSVALLRKEATVELLPTMDAIGGAKLGIKNSKVA